MIERIQGLSNDPNDGGGAVGTYGDDEDQYGGGAVGPYDVIDPDHAEKKLGRFPDRVPPIILPPPPEYVVWWSFADACEVCIDNSHDPPRPYGEPFSSGDTEPPAHDHCRCSLMSALRGSCPIHGHGNRIFELSSRY